MSHVACYQKLKCLIHNTQKKMHPYSQHNAQRPEQIEMDCLEAVEAQKGEFLEIPFILSDSNVTNKRHFLTLVVFAQLIFEMHTLPMPMQTPVRLGRLYWLFWGFKRQESKYH